MRFRPKQHVRRQADIRAVREQGRRIECRAFTVWWKKRDPSAGAPASNMPRVCVIASTKAVGSAVCRNRAKRRLREIFRHQQHLVPADCDLLLIARDATNKWPLPQLETTFAKACAEIAPAVAAGHK
jgi:ribonuclease P protein component